MSTSFYRHLPTVSGAKFRAIKKTKKHASKKHALKKYIARNLLTIDVFPPSSPHNTTQFLMDRMESASLPSELVHQNGYGSMDGMMDPRATNSCRMDVMVDFNINKLHNLEMAAPN